MNKQEVIVVRFKEWSGVAALALSVVALTVAVFAVSNNGVSKEEMTAAISSAFSSYKPPPVASKDVVGLNELFALANEEVRNTINTSVANAVKEEVAKLPQQVACQQTCSPSVPVQTGTKKPAPKRVVAKVDQKSSPQKKEELPTLKPDTSKFWGWYNYESSAKNPKPCLADRPIRGMTENCSNVQTFPRKGNETEEEWTTRAALSQGITGTNIHIGEVGKAQ